MCPTCENTVKNTLLRAFSNPLKVSASHVTGELTLILSADERSASEVMVFLNETLADVGFVCKSRQSVLPKTRTAFVFAALGISTGLFVILLPFVFGSLPFFAMALLGFVSVALTLFLGTSAYKRAFYALFKSRTLHMDALFSVSTLAAMTVSVAAFFVPGLPMMFEAGLLIFGFGFLGQAIRESIEDKVGVRARLQDVLPSRVRKKSGDWVLIEELKLDDEIVIEPGMVIPVDGVCVEGTGLLSESALNGNLDDKPIQPNQSLRSGMVLLEGQMTMRTRALPGDSLLAIMDKHLLLSEQEKKASWQTHADNLLQYFIPMVFILAIAGGILVACLFSQALAIQFAISVLVSACPCTLGLVTGTATWVGMKKAAKHGVLLKSTQTLEEISQIKHVVFDGSGTLTERIPRVSELVVNDNRYNKKRLLARLVQLEEDQGHAYAQAICRYAEQDKKPRSQTQSSREGVEKIIDGKRYIAGNLNMMKKHHIQVDPLTLKSDEVYVYLAEEGVLLGYAILNRSLRREAYQVVQALKQRNIQVHLCTGADKDTAKRIAQDAGIDEDHVVCECDPLQKKAFIDELKNTTSERVLMVGDDGNDVNAAAASDFSLAMLTDVDEEMNRAQAHQQLKEGAHGLLTKDGLTPILALLDISNQTIDNIHQNLRFSLGYNMSAMLLISGFLFTFGVVLNPGIGVALMILQTSLILLNTYRFQQQSVKGLNEHSTKAHSGSSYGLFASYFNLTPKFLCEKNTGPFPSTCSKDTLFLDPKKSTCYTPSLLSVQP